MTRMLETLTFIGGDLASLFEMGRRHGVLRLRWL